MKMHDYLDEIEIARRAAKSARILGEEHYLAVRARNRAIRHAESFGYTLQQLATATGLSKARIQQIVAEGDER